MLRLVAVGCLLVACWLLVGCLLVACWLLVGCLLVDCWLLVGLCCLLFVVCYVLFVVCSLLVVVVCCWLLLLLLLLLQRHIYEIYIYIHKYAERGDHALARRHKPFMLLFFWFSQLLAPRIAI